MQDLQIFFQKISQPKRVPADFGADVKSRDDTVRKSKQRTGKSGRLMRGRPLFMRQAFSDVCDSDNASLVYIITCI